MSTEEETPAPPQESATEETRDTPVPVPQSVRDYAENDPPASDLAPRLQVRDGGDPNATLQFKLQPESCRFITYIAFWTMCILAIILTQTVVGPLLLEGPEDGDTCPPFENGVGFDISEDSHLIRAFGFNNVSTILFSPVEVTLVIRS